MPKVLAEGLQRKEKIKYAQRCWNFVFERQNLVLGQVERLAAYHAFMEGLISQIEEAQNSLNALTPGMHKAREETINHIGYLRGYMDCYEKIKGFTPKDVDLIRVENTVLHAIREYLAFATDDVWSPSSEEMLKVDLGSFYENCKEAFGSKKK